MLYFTLCFRRRLHESERRRPAEVSYPEAASAITNRGAFAACGVVFLLVVGLLVSHAQTGLTVATIGTLAALLITLAVGFTVGWRKALSLYVRMDYQTLLFFVGLFIVVFGLQRTGCLDVLAACITRLSGGSTAGILAILLWFSGLCSAFVDNIPFAATMVPVLQAISQTQGIELPVLAWALSLGTDLGGNATPIGASANVVGTSVAAQNGHPVTWGTYCRYCAPATVLVLGISMLCMFLRYL